ncbi:hypothetical protein AC578_1439 [Pseudocercospora eumusae]|uniref:Magnesium transport protein CorA n=1 Tax=Pseudocercospora eumusae TaxID=321146 RepID=A0A139HUV6_9PEZI|nr:hypothetical protein AC578_1439 [Pseudocercospora eumusae]
MARRELVKLNSGLIQGLLCPYRRLIHLQRQQRVGWSSCRIISNQVRSSSLHELQNSAPSQRSPGHRAARPITLTRTFQTHPFRPRWLPKVGAEPGIDPATKDEKWDPARLRPDATSEIRIIDYSHKQIEERDVAAADLEQFLQTSPKPDWAAVRWIYINGLNFDVVRCLGNHKNLHPLAIEDVLDIHTPTKVDWYEDHCFLELNLAKLYEGDPPRNEDSQQEKHYHHRGRWRTLVPGKFGMSVEQVSAFLTTDHTLITIFERSGNDVFQPIMTRLRSSQTVVRSSNDASMLLQACIDAIVDLSLPIAKAVGEAFDDLEQDVLSRPTIGQSKQLHILRSGLTSFMENANAIGILVRTLCDHGAVPGSGRSSNPSTIESLKNQAQTSIEISATTQIYLRDVQDHLIAVANNTRMSIRSAENLSSLIFNTIAASQNESVRQLTLISSFFLPLTFLTGYFGMNFDKMPIVNENSDVMFWIIAGPVMVTTMLLLMRTRAKINRPEPWQRQTRGIERQNRQMERQMRQSEQR